MSFIYLRLHLTKELEETKEAIKKKGAKWKAEKTSMSELTPNERKKRLGLIPTEEELELIKKKTKDKKDR